MIIMDIHRDVDSDEYDYDIYSKTPPRTKILRKNRAKKNRDSGAAMSSPKVIKAKTSLSRRNTISTMYDDIMAKAETCDSDQGPKRSNKRQMKLLRGSERDLKLDIASAQAISTNEKKNAVEIPITPQPSYQIECSKRFMSLVCRTTPCIKNKLIRCNGAIEEKASEDTTIIECPQIRVDFHNTLSLLVRMGCGDKPDRNPRRNISREEYTWQNELKDVIWLELQAFHADRTPTEEDAYLCSARESVNPLLNEIVTYRFEKHSKHASHNSDSGVEDDCSGCLSMYCLPCMEAQNKALRDVEDLMQRLEAAEALFPSSKAFSELYPLYKSPQFVGRVKAISLWYNMTRHQRLKLVILGKLLALLENKYCQWPTLCDVKTSVDSCSPSDSNSSTSSVNDYLNNITHYVDLYNVTPIAMLVNKKGEGNVSPYRKYIENVLKTRALNKSLNFLDRLHQFVLRKAQLTLEQPVDESIFSRNVFENEEDELRRYGSWSPEAKALQLPSYRAAFLFLAAVPLEVIHEFLVMRVEQKPENPSPLSIRQLMRESKEGLKYAVVQKEKTIEYIDCAVVGTKESGDRLKEKLQSYNNCLLRVFTDYLSYLEQWALLHHANFQKNLLEEEWQFSLEIVEQIPGSCDLLVEKFCFILSNILKAIKERLLERIDELRDTLPKYDDIMFKQSLFSICRELQSLFNEEREMSIKTLAFCKTVFKQGFKSDFKKKLSEAVISFKCIIPEAIQRVQTICDSSNFDSFDEIDKTAMISRTREISMQCFKFGFEFYKEISENAPDNERREKLARSMVQFANLWMKFVTERCERGRGKRPRWAYQGLEFLLTVCDPRNTMHLTEEEFEDLKKNMDSCISHVIGTSAPATPDSGFFTGSPRSSYEHIRARSRGSSPSPRPTYKSQRSNATSSISRKTSMEQVSPVYDQSDSPVFNMRKESTVETTVKINLPPATHKERVIDAVQMLEKDINDKLRKQELIGKVINSNNSNNKVHLRKRHVTFTWQRGIKIGQGRFGKVYTAVNNNTGEMMAVKEIPVQHNDNNTIKRVSEEMKILEGIVHKNLVKYYGVEVHKDEMLLFMEFCAEGTLENLVAATENGLPELLVRRYTFQLVSGVACMHDHGIVHRDIKTANIFLTDEGNCLKIGDFGCAAKIKSHTTMPGELQGFVGTQAYMAPEVFTKNMSEGHGRAADIWSVGCVVVEMSSGKRPWFQFDSNYQIMFKVGMGESPAPPDDMIDEGLDFLDKCFQHDPKDRGSAHELLDHNFVKVGDDLM